MPRDIPHRRGPGSGTGPLESVSRGPVTGPVASQSRGPLPDSETVPCLKKIHDPFQHSNSLKSGAAFRMIYFRYAVTMYVHVMV